LIDPDRPPPKWTLSSTITNMYLTPGTVGMMCILLAVAAYIGFRIVRSG
jgi:hypothetical protein